MIAKERIRESLITGERQGSDAGDVVVLAGHDLQLADSLMRTKKLFKSLADDGRRVAKRDFGERDQFGAEGSRVDQHGISLDDAGSLEAPHPFQAWPG
jgi:hypothetical protein